MDTYPGCASQGCGGVYITIAALAQDLQPRSLPSAYLEGCWLPASCCCPLRLLTGCPAHGAVAGYLRGLLGSLTGFTLQCRHSLKP